MSDRDEVMEHAPEKPSYIVGIGASAGGLSALEQFFDNMPVDTGMAFVVIQHLSPDFKSLMDDLLSRHTSMAIHRVTSGIELQANSIYLIPPKAHMTVKEGKLYLTEKLMSQHIELPIDIFFNSLASDAGPRGIGIVLSGTGSDGSRGVLAIHASGGLVFVQTPESAQFDGMPRNAIATGVCDFVLFPERMPRVLIEYAVNPLAVRTRMSHQLEVFEDEGEYAEIFALLRRNYNLDFSKYKGSTVGRRIRRRMEFRQIPDVSDYAAILSGDPGELDLLYKDLLIGVTEFFRDKQAFQFLEQEVIPQLFAKLHRGEDLRVWSAACATGEEAYSLAILLAEKADDLRFVGKITVFATDVHRTSLDTASQGLYDRSRLTNVSPGRLERFFKKEGGDQFRVSTELRKMVVFAPHNLLNDPPFTRLDLVCCRNLLIYFQSNVQEKVISLFHFALKKDAFLFLGSSEGLGAFTGEFEVVANQHKVFRKIRDLKLALNLDSNRMERMQGNIPVTVFQPGQSRTVSLDRQLLADYDALLRRHVPPGVLIDDRKEILHYFGNLSEYLKVPEGRAENNLLLLVEGNLQIALSTSLQRADSTRGTIVTRNVRVKRGGDDLLLDVTVAPLPDEKSHTVHYHVYFDRVRAIEPCDPSDNVESSSFQPDQHLRQRVGDLETELQSTRENLQATVEELQTTNEELQATNEELLASNEELQSTNEELHSVNEELYSVNSEFERKNLELKQLNTDHDNLLSSTDIGTVFLDRHLRIRKYNPAIATFFKLMPSDIGRPIDHIAYHLADQEKMLADIHHVLAKGTPIEKEEQTRDKKWLLNRIMPFRTETGQVEGVVITFTDITRVKEAELGVIKLNEELERKVEERTRALQEEIQERIHAEELLRVQENFTRSTIDALTAHICVMNERGEFITSNLSWSEYAAHNCNSAEVDDSGVFRPTCTVAGSCDKRRLTENVGDFSRFLMLCESEEAVAGEEGASFSEGVRQVLSGEKPEFVMEYACGSSAAKRWFTVRVNAFTVGGERYAIVAHENITKRKEAELLVAKTRDYYLCILAKAPALIWRATTDGKCDWFNETWLAFTGRTMEEEAGDGWTEGVHSDDLDRCFSTFLAAFGRREIFEMEYRLRRRDGTFRWIMDIGHPLEMPGGAFGGYIGYCFDITERKHMEQELSRRQGELEKLNSSLEERIAETVAELRQKDQFLIIQNRQAAMGEMVGNIAHQWRQPLNALGLLLSNIQDAHEFDELSTEYLDQAIANGERLIQKMSTTINDFRHFFRPDKETVPFSALRQIREAVELVESSFKNDNIVITLDASQDVTLYGFPNEYSQVLLNLLSNSKEAIMASDVVDGRVEISLTERGGQGCLRLADNGGGIPPGILDKIFEPYFSSKQMGTGIGLYMSKMIIERNMNGSIEARNREGGAEFTVTIPLAAPRAGGAGEKLLAAALPEPTGCAGLQGSDGE